MSNGFVSEPTRNPEEPLLDALLRDTLPEIKLALGRQIDRENARALPERYAQLLPETVLVVALRPDAAEALLPVAKEVERELTDSCTRHGSLYDREYRVQLRKAERDDAPLFEVTSHAASELAEEVSSTPLAPPRAPAGRGFAPEATEMAPPSAGGFDPDATRVEGMAPPAGWEPGRFALVVVDEEGEEREVVPLGEPVTTVGRRSEDPRLRSDVAIPDVPHVSRRQLALVWSPREGEPGFRVYNLGLNPVYVAERELPGANAGKGPLRLEALEGEHVQWLAPDTPLRIGERGPTLFVRELPAPAEDPDATQLG